MAKRRIRETKRQRIFRKIKGYTMMVLCGIILLAVIIFAVKTVAGLVMGDESSSADTSTSVSSDVPDSESSSEDSGSGEEVSSEESSSEDISGEVNSEPTGEKPMTDWASILVNKENPMPDDYTVEVRTVKGSNKEFDIRAIDSLEKMLDDARKAGYNMYLVSAYRTLEYQKGLFNRKLNEYKNAGYDDETAYQEASQWVAIPGTSEHCLGLAADIVSSTWYNYNNDLTHDFEDTEHFEWLYEHCADYGFILRFPKGKESITGITYEPWHYRYVGVELAEYIMANNLTLEEFHCQ